MILYKNNLDKKQIDIFLPRFFFNLNKTKCWKWEGSLNKTGYGYIYFINKRWYAHRVSYLLFYGYIDEDLEIDHLCKRRECVNPLHLELVTHKVNTLRSNSPLAKNKNKKVCIRGHAFDIKNTILSLKGRICKKCKHQRKKIYRLRKRYPKVDNIIDSRFSKHSIDDILGEEKSIWNLAIAYLSKKDRDKILSTYKEIRDFRIKK